MVHAELNNHFLTKKDKAIVGVSVITVTVLINKVQSNVYVLVQVLGRMNL